MSGDPPVPTPRRPQVIAAPPRRQPRPADPCAMVIFGAGGDLTKRLVVPALYNLSRTKVLPDKFALIGVDRAEGTVESWRDHLHDMLKSFVGNAGAEFDLEQIDETAWNRLAEKMSYVQGDLNDAGLYGKLGAHLEEEAGKDGTAGNVIFYLAVADRFFGVVVDKLGEAKLVETPEQGGKARFWRRVVIEKPFGHSVDSARELNARILRTLREDQIFRIDHFLGKETVQNIMALRFANGMFEPIWNRQRIDHVQITAAETVGVEQRGKFYEVTGALRDMVPNHVFTLLSLVAMEPPTGFDAASVRTKKEEVFAAMPSVKPIRAVRGQVRVRRGAGQASERLPEGAERRGRFERRDLCRDAARDRQLALGGRAILHPYRQAHVAPPDGDRDPLQAGALRAVSGHARRDLVAQLAGAAHRPGRGNLSAVRCQAPGAGHGARLG